MPRLTMRWGSRCAGLSAQRGAAALIVVMILFFVISMVAAYTNRSLIFEQRTSANQHRSTRALEAADAGLDWALSLLNSGRITATCTISGTAADTDFRQRYLVIDPANGNITPKKWPDPITGAPNDHYPTCVYGGAAWACSCPSDAAPVVAAPAGTDVYPAFRVRFRRVCALPTAPDTACVTPVQPGVVHIDVNGCTTPSETCLSFTNGKAMQGEGRATLHVVAALHGALPTAPAAALTARTGLNVGAASLGVFNSEAGTSGITVQSGGAISAANARLVGPAGTPGQTTLFDNDASLAALTPERMHFNTFGLKKSTFRDQPAAIVMDCSGGCSAAAVRTKVSFNPGRVLWLEGSVDFDSAGDVGTDTQPVVLNVTGNITFGSNVRIYGFVYSQAAAWNSAGSGSIVGAAAAESSFAGSASTDIIYSPSVLTRLRTVTGSFVRVPGTWKDFET